MSAEYLKSKGEALERLRSSVVQNLRRLHSEGVEGEFSFTQDLGLAKQDHQFLSFLFPDVIPTWNRYTYTDGVLKTERLQMRGGWESASDRTRIINSREGLSLEEIPFQKFSENDLIKAAHAIEGHLKAPASVS